jgi:hypothetical protein
MRWSQAWMLLALASLLGEAGGEMKCRETETRQTLINATANA